MRLPVLCLACLLSGAATPAFAADATATPLKLAIADPGRAPDDIARDAKMKPADVMTFAGVKPGSVVAELAPEQGYYARILSILIGPKGNHYLVVPFTGAINADTLRKQTKGQDLPVDEAHAVADIAGYENMLVIWEDLALDGGQFAREFDDPLADPTAVHLEFLFARTAGADAAARSREVGPELGKSRQLIFELRQLHLQATLAGAGMQGEDVENQPELGRAHV